MPWGTFLCSFLILAMMSCMTAAGDMTPNGDPQDSPPGSSQEKLQSSLEVDGTPSGSLEEHQLRKRFIWTLTQEPYFYGKYEGGDGSRAVSQGSELLPEPLPLRKPTSMHKRLYPRWYQAYVYKTPTYNHMARSTGERKRFQPFHPMARFRGLSMGGGSSGGSGGGYHSNFELPLSDQPGHPVPSAPNAQPSPKFNTAAKIAAAAEEEAEEAAAAAQEDEDNVRAGEILQYLRSIASDRGLASNTKSFRFGISRRK